MRRTRLAPSRGSALTRGEATGVRSPLRRPADVLYAPVSYRPPTTPPKVDPDALPEAPHALLLGFLLDRLPVQGAIRPARLRQPGCSPLHRRWRVARVREQALTVMDQDHIANMVQVVRASLHPTVTHRCEHTAPQRLCVGSASLTQCPLPATVLYFSQLAAVGAYRLLPSHPAWPASVRGRSPPGPRRRVRPAAASVPRGVCVVPPHAGVR